MSALLWAILTDAGEYFLIYTDGSREKVSTPPKGCRIWYEDFSPDKFPDIYRQRTDGFFERANKQNQSVES